MVRRLLMCRVHGAALVDVPRLLRRRVQGVDFERELAADLPKHGSSSDLLAYKPSAACTAKVADERLSV